MFIVNWGEVRLYVPISLAAGFFAGNVLVGDLVYHKSRSAFQRTKKAMRWARVHIVEPPKRAARKAYTKAYEWAKARLTLPDDGPSDAPEEPPSEPPSESPAGPPPDPAA